MQIRTAKRLKTDTSSAIEILLYLEGLEDSGFWQAIVFLRKKLQAQATATAIATASAKVTTTTVHVSSTSTETMDTVVHRRLQTL